MTTGFTMQVNEFDRFFINNYDLIRSKSIYFFGKEGADEMIDDQLADCYLKIKNRIIMSGYTGVNYIAYIYSTLFNQFRHFKNIQKRDYNQRRKVMMEDVEFNVEELYRQEQQYQVQEEEQIVRRQRKSERVFKHVELHYSPIQYSIFKQYFLIPEETYSSISKRTGISKTEISNLIKTIKNDLRNNIIDYPC